MLKRLKSLLAKCHWNSKMSLDFYKDAKPKYFYYRVSEILSKKHSEITSEEVTHCIQLLNVALYSLEVMNGRVQHTENETVRS